MPMKKKSKGKSSIQKYHCFICEMIFDGEPYASIDTHDKIKIKVCSDPCWSVCLKEQQDMVEGFEDFIDTELGDFVEAVAQRADYSSLLESIKERIETIRDEMIENQLRQLEQNAKQIS
ncbi:MAG: hypothetical protein Q8N63_08355 [Nanoarchaeota archaeon]|nr:hypothetical protein [Nanoarchaeota archaeon]